MSIYLNKDSRIIVQGMTGGMGSKHTTLMLDAGSNIVGGVNARKAGTTVELGGQELPVFGSVKEAMAETGADVSVVFVPPAFTKDACIEAIDAGIGLLVVITEGVPVQDTAEVWAYLQGPTNSGNTRMIGPNCPGIITPEESLAGITPHTIAGSGPIGLVSKSGTLTYQMMYELKDFGFSTAIGIGGDPIVGTTHIDALAAFEADPDTKAIVMIGEIGGDAEERAAAYIKDNVTKPVVGYVAGFTAPEGKTMGHAGAIVSGSSGTAAAKKEALEAVGVKVGKTPSETASLMREILQGLDLDERDCVASVGGGQLPEPFLGAVRQGDERVGADAHILRGHEGQLRNRAALADGGHQEPHGAVLGHLDGEPPHVEVAAAALLHGDLLDVGAEVVVGTLRELVADVADEGVRLLRGQRADRLGETELGRQLGRGRDHERAGQRLGEARSGELGVVAAGRGDVLLGLGRLGADPGLVDGGHGRQVGLDQE